MQRKPEKYYWRNNPAWYRVTGPCQYEMTENAPKEAVESFKKCMKEWGIGNKTPVTNRK